MMQPGMPPTSTPRLAGSPTLNSSTSFASSSSLDQQQPKSCMCSSGKLNHEESDILHCSTCGRIRRDRTGPLHVLTRTVLASQKNRNWKKEDDPHSTNRHGFSDALGVLPTLPDHTASGESIAMELEQTDEDRAQIMNSYSGHFSGDKNLENRFSNRPHFSVDSAIGLLEKPSARNSFEDFIDVFIDENGVDSSYEIVNELHEIFDGQQPIRQGDFKFRVPINAYQPNDPGLLMPMSAMRPSVATSSPGSISANSTDEHDGRSPISPLWSDVSDVYETSRRSSNPSPHMVALSLPPAADLGIAGHQKYHHSSESKGQSNGEALRKESASSVSLGDSLPPIICISSQHGNEQIIIEPGDDYENEDKIASHTSVISKTARGYVANSGMPSEDQCQSDTKYTPNNPGYILASFCESPAHVAESSEVEICEVHSETLIESPNSIASKIEDADEDSGCESDFTFEDDDSTITIYGQDTGLSALQQKLYECHMRAFWEVHNLIDFEKCAKIISRTGNNEDVSTSSNQVPTNQMGTPSNPTRLTPAGLKRRREDDDSDPPNGDDREPKRPAVNVPRDAQDKPNSRLACPFRKYDPRKFNINDHPICTLNSWDNISRLKEHIYRKHGVQIHCPRCWILFESQDELNVHLSVRSICDLKPERIIEGITAAMFAKLRSRKRSVQSNEDRWQDIYKLLFPEDNRDISPYFEPVQDEAARPDLAPEMSLAEYLRVESPRIFSNLAQAQVQGDENHPTVKLFVKMMTQSLEDAKTEYQRRSIDESLKRARLLSPPSSSGSAPVCETALRNSCQPPHPGASLGQILSDQVHGTEVPPQIPTSPATDTRTTNIIDPSLRDLDIDTSYGRHERRFDTYNPNPRTGTTDGGAGNSKFPQHDRLASPSSTQSHLFGLSLNQQRLSSAINYGQDPSIIDGNGDTDGMDMEAFDELFSQFLKDGQENEDDDRYNS